MESKILNTLSDEEYVKYLYKLAEEPAVTTTMNAKLCWQKIKSLAACQLKELKDCLCGENLPKDSDVLEIYNSIEHTQTKKQRETSLNIIDERLYKVGKKVKRCTPAKKETTLRAAIKTLSERVLNLLDYCKDDFSDDIGCSAMDDLIAIAMLVEDYPHAENFDWLKEIPNDCVMLSQAVWEHYADDDINLDEDDYYED